MSELQREGIVIDFAEDYHVRSLILVIQLVAVVDHDEILD
jgi:hypothetical protein